MRNRRPLALGAWLGFLALATAACTSSTPSAAVPTAPTPQPAPPAPAPPPSQPATARYRITFVATWSPTTHPQDPPGDPHFSGLIGGTHSAGVSFWQEGALATEGIRQMAERGRKTVLQMEIEQATAGGTAEHLLSGDGLSDSPGVVTLDFDVSQAFPLVTLVTMVAPSPDWFVGVTRLPLFENGAWRDSVVVELFAYDAGTDSGESFESPDEETRPFVPIERITGFPFLSNGQVPPLGRFEFRRIQ